MTKSEYNIEPDYPWDDENAVFRHRNNRKWFVLVMNIRRDRLLIHDDRITVKNDFDIDIKVKCLEERVTQAQLAEMVGTSAPYISRLINKKDVIVNKVFVEMLEKLGYDIQITYVKKEQ